MEALLGDLAVSFKLSEARDHEGHEITEAAHKSISSAARNCDHVHLVFDQGIGPIKRLQVFIGREDDGSPFVELTFFPEDVQRSEGLRHEFITWMTRLRRLLRARRGFARYENGSWSMGDIGPTSGVFLELNDNPLDV
jgi:hypothetical protein